MAQLRPKIVKLCHIVGGLTGVVNKIDENAPEYYSLASIVTDDEADVAIAAGLRKNRTAGYLAKKVGKPVEEVEKLAKHLAWIGVFRCTYDEKLGEDVYFMQIFAPGIMEMRCWSTTRSCWIPTRKSAAHLRSIPASAWRPCRR